VVAQTVLNTNSDIGIAFDGDADRVIFCDAKGNVVDGDRILAICALDFKARGLLNNNTLVTTTMSNMGLHEAMKKAGIQLDITDVGDRLVIERMRNTGANVGGEKSGHVILMDYATTGDGIITALQVLRLMRRQGATLAQLAECMQEYPQQLVSIKVKHRKPIETIPNLVEAMEACRCDLGTDGRLIVRYSGTEPKLRILIEAREADQVARWIESLSAVVRKELTS
jgi:phosphoglucosamine mutase